MEKYYFASWITQQKGQFVIQNGTIKSTGQSVEDLEKKIQKLNGYAVQPKIISLKDLTEEEYRTLAGIRTEKPSLSDKLKDVLDGKEAFEGKEAQCYMIPKPDESDGALPGEPSDSQPFFLRNADGSFVTYNGTVIWFCLSRNKEIIMVANRKELGL